MIARRIVLCVAVLSVAACTPQVQLTSGDRYLDAYRGTTGQGTQVPHLPGAQDLEGSMTVDEEVRLVAAVEPTLRFPARIGLAYVHKGVLTAIPARHGAEWLAAAERLGPDFGEFLPVSPLVAMAAEGSIPTETSWNQGQRSAAALIRLIRLGAARQHLDAVVIYEGAGESDNSATPLSVLNVSLIGMALVPANLIEAEGHAQAVLLDVRNGYPYGFASGLGSSTTLSTYANRSLAEKTERVDAADEAVADLIGDVEQMFLTLRDGLAETRE